MKLKKIATIALAGTMALGLLSACGSNTNDANSNSSSNETGSVTLKVGATPAPHAEILEVGIQ